MLKLFTAHYSICAQKAFLTLIEKDLLFYPKPGLRGEQHEAIVLPQILTSAAVLGEMKIQ
jgi:hypothetical protein